ncbi:mce related family protein, partial [Vibrio parahaemolyticus V-223/04]
FRKNTNCSKMNR